MSRSTWGCPGDGGVGLGMGEDAGVEVLGDALAVGTDHVPEARQHPGVVLVEAHVFLDVFEEARHGREVAGGPAGDAIVDEPRASAKRQLFPAVCPFSAKAAERLEPAPG